MTGKRRIAEAVEGAAYLVGAGMICVGLGLFFGTAGAIIGGGLFCLALSFAFGKAAKGF